MRFLAGESCDRIMVRTLRTLGHDVSFVAEFMAGATDDDVLRVSVTEGRVLITQDRDFCALVFRDAKPTVGIVLVRIADQLRQEKAQRITDLVNQAEARLPHAMTTLTLRDVRIRPLGEPPESP